MNANVAIARSESARAHRLCVLRRPMPASPASPAAAAAVGVGSTVGSLMSGNTPLEIQIDETNDSALGAQSPLLSPVLPPLRSPLPSPPQQPSVTLGKTFGWWSSPRERRAAPRGSGDGESGYGDLMGSAQEPFSLAVPTSHVAAGLLIGGTGALLIGGGSSAGVGRNVALGGVVGMGSVYGLHAALSY